MSKNEETETEAEKVEKLYFRAFRNATLAIGGGLIVGMIAASKWQLWALKKHYPYTKLTTEQQVEVLREMFAPKSLT